MEDRSELRRPARGGGVTGLALGDGYSCFMLAALLLALALPSVSRAQRAAASPRPASAAADSAAVAAAADSAALAGVVTDTAGRGVAFAQLFTLDGRAYTVADDSGRFLLRGLAAAPTDVGVRRIGYEPLAFSIGLLAGRRVHVHLRLVPVVPRLSEVTVVAAKPTGLVGAGFYRRRRLGGGTFLDPDELHPWRHASVATLARLAPGVWTERAGMGPGLQVYGSGPRGRPCPMLIYVDGIRVRVPADEYSMPGNLLAMEIYPRFSNVPPEFQSLDSPCGALVAWTRATQ